MPCDTYSCIQIGEEPSEPGTNGTVQIGRGCDVLEAKSHEVLIAAPPDADGNVASIRLRPNGEILVNERLVGDDKAIVEGLRAIMYELSGTQYCYLECAECHGRTTRPAPFHWLCPTCRPKEGSE
jgi:hypothetical protein